MNSIYKVLFRGGFYMYENKKRNLSIYRYLSDMVITIVMLVMLVFIITTLTYKETISVKYLNYVMTASVLFGSYASAVVMKKVYGEEAVKYALRRLLHA